MASTSDDGQVPILTSSVPIEINAGTEQNYLVDFVILTLIDPDGVTSRAIKLIPDPSRRPIGEVIGVDLGDANDSNRPPEVLRLGPDTSVQLNLIIRPAGPPVCMPSCPPPTPIEGQYEVIFDLIEEPA